MKDRTRDQSISLLSFKWGEKCYSSSSLLLSIKWTLVLLLLLLQCGEGGAAVSLQINKCIGSKALHMNATDPLKRHIIDNVKQVTMPLTLEYTDRVSHRLTNAIFKLFIQEVVGYQDVVLQQIDDHEQLGFPEEMDEPRASRATVNLEVWISPGYSDEKWIYMDNLGSQSTGARFGWFVPENSTKYTELVTDHWRSFQKENIAKIFALTKQQLKEVKETFTKGIDGSHYCPDDVCSNGIYVPTICKEKKNCATLFAGQYKYSRFLPTQVENQKLMVQIAWIGPSLTPEFIKRFRGDKPIIFFSWWPSPTTSMKGYARVAFPSCTELHNARANNSLCKYELHTLRKHASQKLEEIGSLAYETVGRFNLHDTDYRTLLLDYNRRTAFNESETLNRSDRVNGWDNAIIDSIACDWLKFHYQANDTDEHEKILQWRPQEYDKKPMLWLAGIFPLNAPFGKYSSKTLVHAANLAVDDINKNTTILNDYTIKMKAENGGCASDEVLYSYIKYIRTADLNYDRMVGILGPSCSDTVEPLAGIAKLLKTVIVSYSAEGAIFNDQGKYPYFFRTIPENKLYRFVYLQLFKELKWRRLASLTEDGNKYSEYLTLLQDISQPENITIFNRKFPREAKNNMSTYLNFLKKANYRIIIGDFYAGMAQEIMCEAFKLKMTAEHGFIWFLPRWFVSKWYDTDGTRQHEETTSCSTMDMLKALNGHLSLGYAYYAADDLVYHSGNTVGQWKQHYYAMTNATPADYAGYTYDAVWTYAFALDTLLKENLTHAANMHSNTTNERFVQLLRKTDFMGVSGHINLGHGSSRNTVVNIMQFRSNFTTMEGNYHNIGKFIPNASLKTGGTIQLNTSSIEWLTPNKEQPGDGSPPETMCALAAFSRLLGLNCEVTIVITMLISFLAFAVLVIVLFVIYKTKYEKIEPPHWQLEHLMNLDEWEISREKVVINRTIGAGAFGTVYGGECLISDERGWVAVAVKTLKVGSTVENKLDFLGEAEMMKQFDHKNIVKLIGLSTRVEPIYMIMEFMLYGDLQTYLLARRHLVSERTVYNDDDEVSSRRLTSMALDIASALEYLANNKYVHRDVACRNCLVNADRVIKLSDFGMTRPVYENNYYRFNRRGMLPVRWMAPESIEDGIYTTKTDMWSYGVLLYEITTFGNFPFQGMNNNQVLEHVVKYGKTLIPPSGMRAQVNRLMVKCWSRKPEQRPEFGEIISLFTSMPRVLVPCLEVPLASVQTNDSDSFDIGIDPTRKTSRNLPRPTVVPTTVENVESSNNRLVEDPMGFSSMFCPNNSMLSRRNRTPVENGTGPTMEPLLPLTGDSYITRYACLQINKSPDASESGAPGITSV